MRRDKEIYQRFWSMALECREAVELIPPRQEFVAVWRYLAANAQQGSLNDEFTVLARKIARSANIPCSFVRTRVCLDVLAERGLIELERGAGSMWIRLTPGPGKVDLERSSILLGLRNLKEGDA